MAKGSRKKPRNIVVVGEHRRTGAVAKQLDSLNVAVDRVSLQDMNETVAAAVSSVVLVTPLNGVPTHRALEQLRAESKVVIEPVFVIVPDGTVAKTVRKLYADGAEAVFEWPREVSALASLVAERLGIVIVRGVTSESDAALARTVRSYLRSSQVAPSGIKVSCHGGTVDLRGAVDTLWKKQDLEELVHEVPGVERVVADDVRVWPTARADDEIEASIRVVLRETSDVSQETLAVSVSNGLVVLAGSVDDRSEVARVLELVSHVKGVRDIDNLMTIAPVARTDHKATARRLERIAKNLLPDTDLAVSVFGVTAVLSGCVRSSRAKRLLQQVVARDDAIDRVVNKLSVSPNTSR
jgi:osmotically-inducible protein OsmY